MTFGVPRLNPTEYARQNFDLVPTVTHSREPLTTDVNFQVQTIWRVGPNPSTGNTGDQWILVDKTGVQSAQTATWRQFAFSVGGGNVNSVSGDDGLVVIPNSGDIGFTGQTVPAATNAHGPVAFIRDSASVESLQVQVASAAGSSILANAGLASFDETVFAVDADGFVTAPGVPPASNGYFRIATGVPNVTGDNTTYTILYDSTPFHNGTDITYNGTTGEFTVNTAGIYHIDCFTCIQNFNNGVPDGTVFTNTFFNVETGHSIGSSFDNSGAHFCPDSGGSVSYMISGLLEANAMDTFRATIQVAGGTKVLQAAGNFGAPNFRDGNYLCYFRVA